VIQVAIRNHLKSLKHGIARTQEQLAAFEARFGLSTAEMERRLQAGEMAETLDTIGWCMELEALRLLEEQYRSLSEARIEDYSNRFTIKTQPAHWCFATITPRTT
jgi:hypothetical protein